MSETQQLLANLDEQIEARVQSIRSDRPWWPCQRGCDHCCQTLAHPPELSAAEWERVEAAVAQLPAAEQAIVADRIDQLLEQIQAGTVTSQVVCPYLNEQEGACRIYAARPVACRTYGFFVARSHDQYCKLIETEVVDRQETSIVWGNAETIRQDIEQISGSPIPFEQHYGDRPQRPPTQ